MGSTPDASGSRVPACPMRRMPVSRRMRATMSCEVGPTGLSRLTTPSIASRQLPLAGGQHLGACLLELRLDRAAGRACVSATPELARDRHRIGSLAGAHRDPDPPRLGLFEEDDDIGPASEAHQVDESL